MTSLIQSLQAQSKLTEVSALTVEVCFNRGHAHQPAEIESRQRCNLICQIGDLRGRDPGLPRRGAAAYLNADLQRGRMVRALRAQPLRDPQPVYGMNPVEMLGHCTGLVRLEDAYEVPADGGTREMLDFLECFLDEIFTEILLPGTQGGLDGCRAMALGDRDQSDRRRVPLIALSRTSDPPLNQA